MRSLVYILLLVLVVPLHAAEVLRVGKDSTNIAVTHDGTRTWMPKDRMCVLQRAREVVCGTVVKSTSKGAIVKLDGPNYDILAGDKVISKFGPNSAPAVAKPAKPTTLQPAQGAPLLNSVSDGPEAEYHIFNASVGVNVGTSFFYPTIGFQFAILPTISVGVGGTYFSSSNGATSLTAFGGYVSANYYSQEYFRGFWVQLGGGPLMMNATSVGLPDESATAFLGFATVGWRGYWDLGFNIGVGAGAQYIPDPQFTPAMISTGPWGIQPMLTLDIGLNF